MTFLSSTAGKSVIIAAVAGSLVFAPLAFAKDNDDKRQNLSIKPVHKSGLEVQIGESGRVLVRGATVTGVSGNTITATTVWGSASVTWTVNASNAQFVDRGGRNAGLADISVGDTVSFNGSLNTSASAFSVNATTVKNWSKDRKVLERHTFEGKLQSIASTTLPTNFVLKVGDTNFTVNVAVGTPILKNNWSNTTLAQFAVGNTVRVYGSVQASSTTTIDAVVVRNASLK